VPIPPRQRRGATANRFFDRQLPDETLARSGFIWLEPPI
jgi:hypothetical protein